MRKYPKKPARAPKRPRMAKNRMTAHTDNRGHAVLLLGHGSKAAAANETLKKIAATVEKEGGYGLVLPAFLQLAEPNIADAVDSIVDKGYKDITVMPYFLYSGLHVTQDIPAEIDAARKKHTGVKMRITRNLGFHNKLIDITIERIEENESGELKKAAAGPCEQHPIEKESFRIIGEELGDTGFGDPELSVVKRVIHTTADFEFGDIIRFSPRACEEGISAIRSGAAIITDVKMVEAGISRARLTPFKTKIYSFSSDSDVIRKADSEGTTRAAMSMQKAMPYLDGAVVAIGNAPTALMELVKLVREGSARPALIIGVPVGFVGAVESKEELMKSACEYITTEGRKGGSTVAVAIVNAIAIEARKRG